MEAGGRREGAAAGLRQRASEGLRVGDTFSVSRTFRAEQTEQFGDLTRDYNPVHYEPAFAAAKGFDGLILHGLLTAGLICEIGGQLAWLATDMSFQFLRPVRFGDRITCELTITEVDSAGRKARAEAVYTNQRGEVVLRGELAGQIPQGGEQELLARMMADGDPTNPLGQAD